MTRSEGALKADLDDYAHDDGHQMVLHGDASPASSAVAPPACSPGSVEGVVMGSNVLASRCSAASSLVTLALLRVPRASRTGGGAACAALATCGSAGAGRRS